ncbi:hypothetical protein EVJ58_g7556 [Rhodofomes roseus]|uniref:Phosphatidylserine decarboxylase n=1 Tax=Rhodofomes roseus TaxID=34475 RepID=A0A4Y9Y2J5_9APHY|nr:hypothetical protein EVJ58_g7556 [Rhodofomes roseus]
MTSYLHSIVDYALQTANVLQKGQVGWMTMNRKTGEYIREQQPLTKKLRLLVLFNPLTDWFDRTHLMRWHLHEQAVHEGKAESSPKSRAQIRQFVEAYNINMADFEPPDLDAYGSFQDFFVRRHRPGSRPVTAEGDDTVAVNAADARVVCYDSVAETTRLWIKGKNFTIGNLITDKVAARVWDDGAVASYRLSPQGQFPSVHELSMGLNAIADYHRYHCPVSGTVRWWKQIDGDYYGVDPIALRSAVNVLCLNARCAVCIDSPEFGAVLFVAIGAQEVGTVKFNQPFMTPGSKVKKGDEGGIFEFGGSAIVVCFEKGRIQFDQDLQDVSRKEIMMDVEVNTSLGKAV